MTITLPAEEDSILARLVALGRFPSPHEAVTEAVRRLERDIAKDDLLPVPLTAEQAVQVYAADAVWELVERSLAGRAKPEV